MRLVGGVAALWLMTAVGPAYAGDCIVSGPPPLLDSQPIAWNFVIASGQSCIRGLRSGAMILDSVTLTRPSKSGDAVIKGYGFAYAAPRDFKGDDSFEVTMMGSLRGVHGKSVISVHVSVR